MKKKVIGVYETEAKVIEMAMRLQQEGYDPEEISVVANENQETFWIGTKTNAQVESESQKTEEPDFWTQVKAVFSKEVAAEDEPTDYTARLVNLGLSETQAQQLDEDIRKGKIVLLAPEKPKRAKKKATLDTTVDVEEHTVTPEAHVTETADQELTEEEQRTIRLREEELEVNKEEVEAGEVKVFKTVHEDTKRIDVPVTREELHIEKKPVDGAASELGIEEEMKEETIVIPLKEERVDVSKKTVVKQEVEIGKHTVEDTKQVTDKVKREELNVDGEEISGTEKKNK